MQEDGVARDLQGPGLAGVQERVVDDDRSARGKRRGGGAEQLLHDVLVPVVQHVRKEVDVVVSGERIGQHVAGDDVDASGEAAALDGAPGDPIDRRLFQHRRGQRRDCATIEHA